MSWMDSWSRPSKSQATPPPYYLLPGGDKVQYCKSCGRVIGDRKKQAASSSATPAKYCSARCRGARVDKGLQRRIEDTFASLLNGELPVAVENTTLERETPPYKGGPSAKTVKRKKKGENRILVQCSDVESVVFGDRKDPEKRFGRRKNRARRGVKDGVWRSVDMVSDEEGPESNKPDRMGDDTTDGVHVAGQTRIGLEETDEEDRTSDGQDIEDGGAPISTDSAPIETSVDADVIARLSIRSGTRIRPPQGVSEVNGGIGGEKGVKERISETDDMLAKRREGQRKADERELVRCAARRGVAFGFLTGVGEERRLCEAVMQGKVVESSFAKGEWGVRWRE
ncbi:hypothetical protein LHYA1_G004147 [Lachnellula hyalina]|uniref:Uncharacterized protein n=1 Tax=Lachnellula hyalina TaxID=1316788 RepID=A0A8H8U162_9HELO|nr:uncharacterized protein LHYA1_G004147 [Lachnellula hyalina]TVY26696.1 hypothetical protein LHYA1_G004147 [Lachnellula hyalina]